MSLKSHCDPTNGLFVMVQQEYDDEPVNFSYMAEVNQEVAAILPLLPLLLERRLEMNFSQHFRYFYTIGTVLWIKWFLQVWKTIWKILTDIGYIILMTARCKINSTRGKIMEAMQLTLEPLISQVHWTILASWRMVINHYTLWV